MKLKRIFLQEFIDLFEKLAYPKLPDKRDCFSKLNNSDIRYMRYMHAHPVQNTFQCETLGDYTDIYLTVDFLLVANVFEKFWGVCLRAYGLDLVQYFTSPGLSWDVMLKLTSLNLELFTYIDMHHFYKKGTRGCVPDSDFKFGQQRYGLHTG